MATYFNLPADMDSIKRQYRDLVKQYHPDICKLSNATQIMQDINAEYEILVRAAYKEESGEKYSRAAEDMHVDIINKVQEIITLDVEIEICGTWVWVGGNTYPHRETLNKAGFKFSGNKRMWYFSQDLTCKRRGHYDMNQIRNKYGSQRIETQHVKAIG